MTDWSPSKETDFGFGDPQTDGLSLTWETPIPDGGSFDAERFLALHFAEDDISLSALPANPAPVSTMPEWGALLFDPAHETALPDAVASEDAMSFTQAFDTGEETGISTYLLHLSWTDLGGKYDPLMVAIG